MGFGGLSDNTIKGLMCFMRLADIHRYLAHVCCIQFGLKYDYMTQMKYESKACYQNDEDNNIL